MDRWNEDAVYVSRIAELLALKEAMTGREVTVTELADYIGVSRQTIHTWMSPAGVVTLPKAEWQLKLERFFNVPWKRIWKLSGSLEDTQGQVVAEAQA